MASTKLTRYEQETVINYNNEEKHATVYTADPVTQRRLDKLVAKFPNDYKCTSETKISETQCAKTYEISSKKYVSYRSPMSEAHRKANAERLASYRNNLEDK